VAVEYSNIVEKEHPALLATLICLGLQDPYFKQATGWEYGVHHHKYESRGHHISIDDLERLRRVINEKKESEPDFWVEYIDRGTSKASRLITTAQSLAKGAEAEHDSAELAEGFKSFAETMKEAAPFVVATPEVQAALESLVTTRIAEELEGENGQKKAAEILSRLKVPEQESEGVREIRNSYRIALEIGESKEALDLVLDKMPATALSRLEAEHQRLHRRLHDHVDEYGWLRTQGSGLDPLSPRELLERIQAILLRWKPEMIRQAAELESQPNPEQSLGFSPSDDLERLIGALQELMTRRSFRIELHLQAFAIARPFLAGLAEALGCTTQQLAFSSVEEIAGALTEESELPISEVDLRFRNSFTVVRSGDDLRVHSNEDAPPDEGTESAILTGQSVCRGRAVGAVKVILGATEVVNLEVGDVLVSEASTPDKMGTESAFPGRTDAPLGLEKAAAIVTDEGGLLSHAAIISRELGIPCVVGTERASSALTDGQVVEVDATKAAGRVIPWESP
jgi:phosphohistidine swiveling domain-containing protein